MPRIFGKRAQARLFHERAVRRVAVLTDERDSRLGFAVVPERTMLIRHNERLFLRTGQMVRLPGGGLGAVFEETEPADRPVLSS